MDAIGLRKGVTRLKIFVFISVLLMVEAKNTIIMCEEDHECRENQFCYMETGMCANCMNCSAYFRKIHKWKSCSKLPLECGECFDGYEADALTNGKVREYCSLRKNQPVVKIAGISVNQMWSIAGIIITLFLLALIIVIFYIYIKTPRIFEGKHNKTEENNETREEKPPSYTPRGTSPLLTSSTVIGESDYRLQIRETVDNSFQKAVPLNYGAYYRVGQQMNGANQELTAENLNPEESYSELGRNSISQANADLNEHQESIGQSQYTSDEARNSLQASRYCSSLNDICTGSDISSMSYNFGHNMSTKSLITVSDDSDDFHTIFEDTQDYWTETMDFGPSTKNRFDSGFISNWPSQSEMEKLSNTSDNSFHNNKHQCYGKGININFCNNVDVTNTVITVYAHSERV